MAYKAKFNINIAGTNFEKGHVYSDEEVKECDLSNFDEVTDQGGVADASADLDSEKETVEESGEKNADEEETEKETVEEENTLE